MPRVECSKHGVHTMQVPWAEGSSRFTALFEALVIDWLKEAPLSSVGRQVGLTWEQVSGIMERAFRVTRRRRR